MLDVLETVEEIEDEFVVPESRFLNANAARSYFEVLFRADQIASRRRATIQKMFDGEPPYTEAELAKSGQSFRCNVNFGEGEDLMIDSQSAYIDMMQSVEVLFHVETTYGDTTEERKRYSKAISKKLSDAIRRWPMYYQRYLLNCTYFVGQGVSFVPFLDHITWQYKVRNQGEFYVPRDCDAGEEAVPVAFSREHMDVVELYDKIRNPAAAKSMGWDVDAVKKTILSCAKKTGFLSAHQSWEDWATKTKNNDFDASAGCQQIELLYCWVVEFDKSVSMHVLTREAGCEEFLFSKPKAYKSMAQAFTSFTYGVGTAGKYHGIRSLGNRILAPVQLNNRLTGQHVDGSMLASSMPVQPKSEADLGRALVSFRGPYTVIHPNATVPDVGGRNFAQNTLPVIRQITDLIRAKAGSYTSSKALPDDGREMSQYEASARIANAAGLTATNLVLYMVQSQKLYREQVRRMTAKGYPENWEGGDIIKEILEELEEEGIPVEAFYAVKSKTLVVTMPVGAGSAAARDRVYHRVRELAPGMDPLGQRRFLRDQVANAFGSFRQADEYVPLDDEMRLPEVAKLAMMENLWLYEGKQIPAQGNEYHIIHLDQHTSFVLDILQQVDAGGLPMEEAAGPLATIHDHATQHLKFMEGDPVVIADSASYRQTLQQAGEIILDGMRKLQKQRREGEGQEGQEGQIDPKTLERYAELEHKQQLHEMNMAHLQEKTELEKNIAITKAMTDRLLAESKAAASLSPFHPSNVRPLQ